VNALIQGSAAECTKEAIIRFYRELAKRKKLGVWKLLLNVHDQLTASVPIKELKQAMDVMRDTMQSVEFDLPILTEGAISKTNWAELVDYDKRGKLV
jgi:DNA polymerase I-like protein with 3'-5' exonuclease and polymerase domains